MGLPSQIIKAQRIKGGSRWFLWGICSGPILITFELENNLKGFKVRNLDHLIRVSKKVNIWNFQILEEI